MSRVALVASALVTGAVVGIVAGLVLLVGYHSAVGWVAGGAVDPRCSLGWRGYAEIHQLGSHGEPDRVACEYRPGLVPP